MGNETLMCTKTISLSITVISFFFSVLMRGKIFSRVVAPPTSEGKSPRSGGRDSMFGIMTVYGLDGPGFEPRWGKEFFLFQTGSGAHQAFSAVGTGALSWTSAAEAWR